MADPTIAAAPPPGLINSPPPVTSAPLTPPVTDGSLATNGAPAAATYTAAQGQTTPYSVPTTVASQIDSIIAAGSPLMQQATAKANETMNARGLMNSTQAITAGETGLINAATPIATADALAYQTAANKTSDANNSMTQFNTGQQDAALSAGATQSNSLTQTRMNNETALAQQDKVDATNLQAIQAQGVINTQLTNLNNANKLLLQSNSGAANLYSQQLAYMATISTNPDMSAEQKTQALNNAVMNLNDGLAIFSQISGTPEVQSTLTFGDQSAPAGQNFGGTPDAVWPPANPAPNGGGGLFG